MNNEFVINDGVLQRYEGKKKIIVVPEGVTKIANYAFGVNSWEPASNIASITLPDSVQEVGIGAFSNLKKLASYTAPAGILYGDDAFHNCSSLADETGFVIIDGIAMEYVGKDESVTVPEGVHTLASNLFGGSYHSGNKKITAVHLPSSLKKINSCVFSDCTALEQINIPETLEEIGDKAFFNCTSLKEVCLPSSLTKLGDEVFCGCKAMADAQGFVIKGSTLYSYYIKDRIAVVPDGIETIANNAFKDVGIASVVLPSTLKKLGAAFTECTMLSEIVIPEGVEELPDSIFSGCIRLSQVSLPSTLKAIGKNAFVSCKDLKTIVIPDGVRQIGSNAFSSCTSLESIVLPSNLSRICDYTFRECSCLKHIEIPASVTEIEDYAFKLCRALKEVKVDASAKITVTPDAFDGCSSLMDENGFSIVSNVLLRYLGKGGDVIIPEGVAVIAANAFREGMGEYRFVHYRDEGSLHSVKLPESLTTICDHAFTGCEKLRSIQLPDSVTTLGNSVFANCKSLTQVDIGSGITALPDGTFQDCAALRKISIPKHIEGIGKDVFLGCKKLFTIEVDAENPHYTSADGILFDMDKAELLFCPGGAIKKEYVIPDFVTSVADHAFYDCSALEKIVIPASVASLGSEVFARDEWNNRSSLKDIEVSPKAGAKQVGSQVFDFSYGDGPLNFPKLPISFVRETSVQLRLAMGYCQHPEKYEGEYAQAYKKYADSHEKSILKKAKQLKLAAVEAYFAKPEPADNGQKEVFKPNVSSKKLSELAKVALLEETVQKGTLEDLELVLNTYKNFEITARALAIAGRYRGLEFVKALVKAGASFAYESSSTMQRKYKTNQDTAAGSYRTEYYLMLVPEKLTSSGQQSGRINYSYSPLCGLPEMEIPYEMEKQKKVLPIEERFEIAKYCWENKKLKVSMDEMLFWALTRNEIPFADLLIAYGANLNTTPPEYYYWTERNSTYLDIVTSGNSSVYWNSYVEQLAHLSEEAILPVLERLHQLSQAAEKKLAVTQTMFNDIKWNDQSLVFLLKNADMSKLNQKKALEMVVSRGLIGALDQMSQMGWLSNSAKREKLIEFAQSNNVEALAWLMDFKNRTVDAQAEAAREEKKFLRELSEDPNSVTALKRIWSYKKLEDGTLIITSYKGEETDVVVPAMIGKSKVTVIGEDALSANWTVSRIKNRDARTKIKSITVSEGIVEIQSTFSSLDELEKLVLPSTIKKLDVPFVMGCPKLKEVILPASVSFEGKGKAFVGCNGLEDQNGSIIFNSCLYAQRDTNVVSTGYFTSKNPTGRFSVPEGITEIADYVFKGWDIKTFILPDGLQVIGKSAFAECFSLTEVNFPETLTTIKAGAFQYCEELEVVKLPKSVTSISAEAFDNCTNLREFYISANTTQLGKAIFGLYDDDPHAWDKVNGICVHTQEGAPIVEYLKHYEGIYVKFDYDEGFKD